MGGLLRQRHSFRPRRSTRALSAARQANKIVPCKWAGTPNKGSGLRTADETISEYQHAGLRVQNFRIPDNVLRLARHKGRGIETEHPAVFAVVLPAFLMRTYTDEGEVVLEPFGGLGTTILAGQRPKRRVRAIELAPAYVDLAVARLVPSEKAGIAITRGGRSPPCRNWCLQERAGQR
ncbi:MAG: site-specific DNA-methyltransferase [Rubritepida sp.]|nr:site-specific DNA-methyltransferase [Rubritepida sp.]